MRSPTTPAEYQAWLLNGGVLPPTPPPPAIEQKKIKVKGIKNAEYEIIEIKDGFNIHTTLKEPLAKKSYERERFLVKRTFMDKVHSRIRFLVVLKSPAKDGEKPMPVCLSDKVDVSSRLLYTVKTSRTLRSALAGLFRKPFGFGGFGGKKLLFVGVIIIVGVVVYMVYSGYINLGSIIKF